MGPDGSPLLDPLGRPISKDHNPRDGQLPPPGVGGNEGGKKPQTMEEKLAQRRIDELKWLVEFAEKVSVPFKSFPGFSVPLEFNHMRSCLYEVLICIPSSPLLVPLLSLLCCVWGNFACVVTFSFSFPVVAVMAPGTGQSARGCGSRIRVSLSCWRIRPHRAGPQGLGGCHCSARSRGSGCSRGRSRRPSCSGYRRSGAHAWSEHFHCNRKQSKGNNG